jgi:hypothetical protein
MARSLLQHPGGVIILRVLVTCEFSGRVREAFRKRGHIAFSCDLLPADDRSPFHYQEDIFSVLARTEWDLMIAHPPCTFLCSSGLHWNIRRPERRQQTEEALQFVEALLMTSVDKMALENPVGCISSRIRKPDQIIQPWQFGHGEVKGTCLWLKGLPKLVPTNVVEGREPRMWKLPPSADRGKLRSVTYQGIADAMGEQWGNL